MKDTLGRALKDLRISVTDRCNFRCSYCMPLEKYEWIERSEILTFEEITRFQGFSSGWEWRKSGLPAENRFCGMAWNFSCLNWPGLTD